MKTIKHGAGGLTPAQLVNLQEEILSLWNGDRTARDMVVLEGLMLRLRQAAPDAWAAIYSTIQSDIDLEEFYRE